VYAGDAEEKIQHEVKSSTPNAHQYQPPVVPEVRRTSKPDPIFKSID
jgi:hypothetical protein